MAVTINGTTGVAVPLGTAAAPGVVNTTSATTGIYNPTSTTLGLSTNGTNAVYIDASQNVGIGTTSPRSSTGFKTLGIDASTTPVLDLFVAGTRTATFSATSAAVNLTAVTAIPLIFNTTNAEAIRIDSSGNVLVTNAAGLGYGTGSGGTVTQATSKSTGVTLNKPAGKITMANSSLAANTNVSFILTNSTIANGDLVLVNINDNATLNAYQACAENSRAGTVYIMLRNTSSGSLAESVVLTFSVIKSVSA